MLLGFCRSSAFAPHCDEKKRRLGGSADETISACLCRGDPAAPDFLIPAGTLVIQSEAFAGIGAAVVYIPDRCGSIGAAAFRDCPNLRQVRIPAGCAIGTDAFAGDFGLKIFGYRGSPAPV